MEGKYLIQTEEHNLGPLEAVRIYKELSEVERAFANLKDVIELRPIYHQTERGACKPISLSPRSPFCSIAHSRKNSRPPASTFRHRGA